MFYRDKQTNYFYVLRYPMEKNGKLFYDFMDLYLMISKRKWTSQLYLLCWDRKILAHSFLPPFLADALKNTYR